MKINQKPRRKHSLMSSSIKVVEIISQKSIILDKSSKTKNLGKSLAFLTMLEQNCKMNGNSKKETTEITNQ